MNAGRKALENMYVHLTNYSLNKDNTAFIAPTSLEDETAHKRTLTSVFKTLRNMGKDVDKMWKEVKDIIIKTLLTVQPDLAHNYRTCQPADTENLMCFELLGFDVILTADMKPILLEVNHAPSFATDSPLDYDIKRNLFVDMFRLLDFSIKKKKEKIQGIYEDKLSRMTSKQTLKERTQCKKQNLRDWQK